nr:oligosaccharide flippase family protein [Belliella kenyensis]
MLGRGVPGLINFAALSIYTRLLSPEVYGRYALAYSSVTLLNTLLFQWIRMSLLRYLPKFRHEEDKRELYGSIAAGFFTAGFLSLILVLGTLWILPNEELRSLIYVALLLLWTEAFFEIALEILRSNLEVKQYAISFMIKSTFALLFGITLLHLGFEASGILLAIALSTILTTGLCLRHIGKLIFKNLRYFNRTFFLEFLQYGIPFTITFGMTFIFNSSDRYFINYFLGEKETGLYAVAYDLARQSLWVIMTAINLGSFPLAIRALENDGVNAANNQLSENLILLLKIAMPLAFGFMALNSEVVDLIIGEQFAEEAKKIIPYIVLGTLMVGFKNFYFDQGFQLGKRTYLQIYPVILAAVVNILLNLFIITWLGVFGAVISTLVSFFVALIASAILSRRVYKLPLPLLSSLKILISSMIMGLLLYLAKNSIASAHFRLLFLAPVGSLVYIGILRLFKINFFR